MEKENKNESDLPVTFLLLCLISILVSFWFFYFKKDYDFFVETSCDPASETCFFRDCENDPDICPPNNFSYYNQYVISAKDYTACVDEDCTLACSSGVIECTKINCTEDDVTSGVCLLPQDILSYLKSAFKIRYG